MVSVKRKQGHYEGGEQDGIHSTRAGQQHLQHEHPFRQVQQVPQPQASQALSAPAQYLMLSED
jgi:hypothetical protein